MIVSVDSSKRNVNQYPLGNSYSLFIPDVIQRIYQVDLVMAQVPNTIWNLSHGAGCITLNGTSLSIPNGIYTSNTLVTALNSVMTGVTLTYLSAQGLMFFGGAAPFTLQVNFSDLATLLGLPVGSYSSSTTDTFHTALAANSVMGQNIINFSANQMLYLDIDEFRSQLNQEAVALTDAGFLDGSSARRSFAAIPLDVDVAQIKNFSEMNDYRVSVCFPQPISKLSRLTVRWVDSSGNLVNFNGNESHSFILRIHTAVRQD